MSDKNFKIWGMGYGLIGDLIMSLPLLTYYERKYPGSYKYWVIEKKCSQSAPLYFNHPLIDQIRITEEWSAFGEEDRKLRSQCQLSTRYEDWKHDEIDWYNYRSCVEETARVAGVYDLKEVLTEEEMYPKLYQWFDTGFHDSSINTYSKERKQLKDQFINTVAIWPFATAGGDMGRSPSVKWWQNVCSGLFSLGFEVFHFGRSNEPDIVSLKNHSQYKRFTHLPYFEQVKLALATTLSIGTDSGSMWVMGAYSHPAIHLMTNWMLKHTQNVLALAPINRNCFNLFAEKKTDNVKSEDVLNIAKGFLQ